MRIIYLTLVVLILANQVLAAPVKTRKKAKKISKDAVVYVIKRPPKKKPVLAPVPEPAPAPEPTPEPAPEPVAAAPEPVEEPKELDGDKSGVFSISVALTANKDKTHGSHQQGGEAWLTSLWGLGGAAAIEYNFTNSFSLFADYYLDRVVYDLPSAQFLLLQDKKFSHRADLGARIGLGRYFFLKMLVGLKQDYAFYIFTLPNAVVDQFWHGVGGIALGYNIWQNNSICFGGETGLDIYIPTKKSAYETGIGTGVNTLLRLDIKSNPGFYTFFKYEYYQLKVNTFTNQSGHRMLGGLGISLFLGKN